MKRNGIVLVALAVTVSGCGHAMTRPRAAVEPSASVTAPTADLAGHWHGTVWETGGSLYQGLTPLDLHLRDDGTWSGTVGKAPASGTARLDRRGHLVLSGTAITPDGRQEPVSFSLTGDSSRRWAAIVGRFQGREEHASVALRKVS